MSRIVLIRGGDVVTAVDRRTGGILIKEGRIIALGAPSGIVFSHFELIVDGIGQVGQAATRSSSAETTDGLELLGIPRAFLSRRQRRGLPAQGSGREQVDDQGSP